MAYGVSKSLENALQWFVMGYSIEHVGNMLLILKLHKQKSIYGVSIQSQICLMVATIFRCCWFSDSRLPTLQIAFVEILVALLLHIYILYLCYQYRDQLYH